MKNVLKHYGLFALLTFSFSVSFGQTQNSRAADSVICDFEARVKAYAGEREEIERSIRPIPKQASPRQIAEHKAAFLKAVQKSRSGLKQGAIFTPAIAAYFKRVIAIELDATQKAELRKEVIEAENKAVAIRVDYPYPESQEILEMPATLLLVLPQLPKQLKYRFVGRHMLLVDRENALIVDYVTNAVP
ncbi:MAG: hypothetical protein PSX80_03950 [bacterium]|nr:hypothetical protein [bacterium]